MKKNFNYEFLLKDFPQEITNFIKDVRNLGFEEAPDYPKYKKALERYMRKNGIVRDNVYDWMIVKEELIKEV